MSIPAAVSLALAVVIVMAGLVWLLAGSVAVNAQATGVMVNPPANTDVVAPVSGTIELGPPLLGTIVERGQEIALLRTDSGKATSVRAPLTGMVVELSNGNNGPIFTGQTIATLAPTTQPMIAYIFVSSTTATSVARGDQVAVTPAGINSSVQGQLVGAVEEVVPLPASTERINYLVSNDELADQIIAEGPVNEVIVTFTPVADNPSQLQWSKGGATPFIISGTQVAATVTLAEESPWKALLGL